MYSNRINMIREVNYKLLQFVRAICYKMKLPNNNLSLLFTNYYNNNYHRFVYRPLNRDVNISNIYAKLLVNLFKFNKFLPGVKALISRIYLKDVEFNIVNLKYHHLNSDIFVQSLTIKLRKRLDFIKTLKSCLSLVETPYQFLFKKYDNINKISDLNVYKSLKVNNIQKKVNNEDLLYNTIESIFPRMFSRDIGNNPTKLEKSK